MQSIYLSYRPHDTDAEAALLFQSLAERFGDAAVLIDPARSTGAAMTAAQLHADLGRSSVLLALVGPGWDGSSATGRAVDAPDDPVRAEIAAALSRRVPVVVVQVHGARLPPTAQLPSELAALALRPALELSLERWNADVAALADTVQPLLGLVAQRRLEARRAALARAAASTPVVSPQAAATPSPPAPQPTIDLPVDVPVDLPIDLPVDLPPGGPAPAPARVPPSSPAPSPARPAPAGTANPDSLPGLMTVAGASQPGDLMVPDIERSAARADREPAEPRAAWQAWLLPGTLAAVVVIVAGSIMLAPRSGERAGATAPPAPAPAPRASPPPASRPAETPTSRSTEAPPSRPVEAPAAGPLPRTTAPAAGVGNDPQIRSLSVANWAVATDRGCGAGPLRATGTAEVTITRTPRGVLVAQTFSGSSNGWTLKTSGSATFDTPRASYVIESSGLWLREGAVPFRSVSSVTITAGDGGLTPTGARGSQYRTECPG